MKLEDRSCVLCEGVFRVMPRDRQKFCSIKCQREFHEIGKKSCQKLGTSMKKEISGTTELGDLASQSKKENSGVKR